MLVIVLAIDDMVIPYSQLLAVLLNLLSRVHEALLYSRVGFLPLLYSVAGSEGYARPLSGSEEFSKDNSRIIHSRLLQPKSMI